MSTYKLFFSSCFEDPLHERLKIRDRVAALNTSQSKCVWMAEGFDFLKPLSPASSFDKALFCVEGVRQSDAYVAVVKTRHGSGVHTAPAERIQTSYFELELFEAAILRKPAHVFLLKGAEPNERIKALLQLLAPALPGLCWTPLSEDEIFSRIVQILENHGHSNSRTLWKDRRASDRRMVGQLAGHRHRTYDPRKDLPNIQFLGGLRDETMARPDSALVEHLLDRAGSDADFQVRMVLLWAAIRELMGVVVDRSDSVQFLPLWERALEKWNEAGAWYGLHGHPVMGCLGALSSLTAIRSTMRGSGRPHGAFSSEYYSIAKRVGARPLKNEILEMARRHNEASFDEGETSGRLAMRGSISAAIHGYAAALTDFERVVYLRDNVESATDAEKADARTELGFALINAGQRQRGLALMQEGTLLFNKAGRTGFLIRAKRKLGVGYFLCGSPRKALSTLAEAYDIAMELRAFDQIGQIEKISKAIESRRFLRGP